MPSNYFTSRIRLRNTNANKGTNITVYYYRKQNLNKLKNIKIIYNIILKY